MFHTTCEAALAASIYLLKVNKQKQQNKISDMFQVSSDRTTSTDNVLVNFEQVSYLLNSFNRHSKFNPTRAELF